MAFLQCPVCDFTYILQPVESVVGKKNRAWRFRMLVIRDTMLLLLLIQLFIFGIATIFWETDKHREIPGSLPKIFKKNPKMTYYGCGVIVFLACVGLAATIAYSYAKCCRGKCCGGGGSRSYAYATTTTTTTTTTYGSRKQTSRTTTHASSSGRPGRYQSSGGGWYYCYCGNSPSCDRCCDNLCCDDMCCYGCRGSYYYSPCDCTYICIDPFPHSTYSGNGDCCKACLAAPDCCKGCPGSDCNCKGCDCKCDGDAAGVLLIAALVLVVVFALIGLVVGFFLLAAGVQRIIQRHMKTLRLRVLAREYTVMDLNGVDRSNPAAIPAQPRFDGADLAVVGITPVFMATAVAPPAPSAATDSMNVGLLDGSAGAGVYNMGVMNPVGVEGGGRAGRVASMHAGPANPPGVVPGTVPQESMV
jgi:hypothetical protein